MRYLVIFLFFVAPLSAQEYFETTILDVSGLAGDSILKPLSWKVKDPGANVTIDFTSVNCDLLGFNLGYSPKSDIPLFIDTIPNVQLPITLDKTVYTNTYNGVESNAISIDITWYDDNYLWFGIIDNAACTSGEIKVILKRK